MQTILLELFTARQVSTVHGLRPVGLISLEANRDCRFLTRGGRNEGAKQPGPSKKETTSSAKNLSYIHTAMDDLAPWQTIAVRKRDLRDKALKPFLADNLDRRGEREARVSERSRIEPENAHAITEIDSVEVLLQGLAEAAFTAEDVVFAYIKRFG